MPTHKRFTTSAIALALIGAAVPTMAADSFSDSFDSADDSAYVRYDPISAVTGVAWGTWSIANGAYTLSANASPNPAALGPARVASFRKDFTANDFTASVDVTDWDNSQSQFFGIAGRINSPGLGSTAGYLMGYDINGPSLVITRIANEAFVSSVALQDFTLDAAKDYRLVASAIGTSFSLSLFDLADTSSPLASIAGSDSTFAGGLIGVATLNNSSAAGGTARATFDNFGVTAVVVPEPGTLALFGVLGGGLALAAARRRR